MEFKLHRIILFLVLACFTVTVNAAREKVKDGELKITRILFFIMIFFSQYVSAYSETVVRIQMVNGDKYEIPFADEPEMAFQDENLNINGLNTSLVLTRSQIDDIQFVNTGAGIKDVLEDKAATKMVWTNPRHLTIYGERVSPLNLYSLNGTKMNLQYQEFLDHVDANFDNLPEGIYILSIGEIKTIKININR